MDNFEIRRFEMFRRARDFGVAHAADLPAGTLGSQLFTTLNNIVTELETLSASQSSGLNTAMEGTASKSAIRAAISDSLVVINRTARALAFETPGLDNKFRLPRKGNDHALLAAARAFAADAAPLAQQFIQHEVPADFLSALNGQITEFGEVLSKRSNARETHVSATAGIDDAIERGVDMVQRLDVIVRNKYALDHAILAAWDAASHTERLGPKDPKPTEPPKP